MSQALSYKDIESPFNEGRFPYTAVDPMKTTSRRSHLKQFFVWFLPLWSTKLGSEWKAAENAVCKTLARTGRKSCSKPWFEFQVDKVVYLHFFRKFKEAFKETHQCNVPDWPWEEISEDDLVSGQDSKSDLFDRYLKKQEVAAIAAEKNESAMDVDGPAVASNSLNPAAPAFEPSAEATSLEDGEIATSEEVQTQTVNSGQLRRRKGRNNRSLHDSMFARGHGSGRGRGSARGSRRGRGTHQSGVDRQPSPEDEFEWNKDDQEPSGQNTQVLGASGSEVTGEAPNDVDMDRLNRPLFEPNTLALTKMGIESSLFAPANTTIRPKITNEVMLEDMSNNGSDQQKRSRVWDRVYGSMAIREPIVGPFEMNIPDCIPTQVYISEERLAKANNTYLRDVQITFNRQERRLTVGFAAKQGPGSFPSRMEIVNIWQAVKQWMQEVCSEIPSCLDDVIYRVLRKPTTIPDQAFHHSYGHLVDSANVMPARLNEIGQELPALRKQLGSLMSGDFIRTKAGVENWLNSQLKPFRAIRAATAEWLLVCNSDDEAMVLEWSVRTKEHVQEMRGEMGIELK